MSESNTQEMREVIEMVEVVKEKNNRGNTTARTEEQKQHQSEVIKEYYANNPHPMQDKHHKEATKLKISQTQKEKYATNPEIIKQRSEKRKISKDREQEIIDAYNSGMILADIVRKYQASYSTIYRVLDRNGLSK